MRSQSLTNTTSWQDTHSVGASHQNYGMSLAQNLLNNPNATATAGSGMYWTFSGTSPDGNVFHVTNVYVANDASPKDYQDATWCRLACYYLINHLDNKSIIEACESLYDIYKWQSQSMPPLQPEMRRIGTVTPKQVGKVW